jgi:hypothetical protein
MLICHQYKNIKKIICIVLILKTLKSCFLLTAYLPFRLETFQVLRSHVPPVVTNLDSTILN